MALDRDTTFTWYVALAGAELCRQGRGDREEQGRHVMPVHYGTFPLLAGTPDELRRELDARGVEAEVHAPQPGGTVA